MKSIAKVLALLGVAALAGVATHAQTSTNQISLTTFGPDTIPPWGFTYFYGNNGLGTAAYNTHFYAPEDTDMTNGMWQFTFDATALDGTANWGAGTGGPLSRENTDPTLFVSGDRADYILTFDAKADGLLDGQASANAEFQLQIGIPDSNGGNGTFQVNVPFHPSTNWQTIRVKLSDGTVATGGGKVFDEDFAARHDQVTGLQFAVNMDQPFNAFGYDDNNALYLDNVKLEVIDRGETGPQPTYAKTILDWNLDDKGLWFTYGPFDWSENSTHATFSQSSSANDLGTDGSAAWALMMDNTAFADAPPAWAGAGVGGGGPMDFSLFDSPDLANYRITFDARALGLGGVTGTSVALQLFFQAPDDTLQPADADTGNDGILQLNLPVNNVGTDWKRYSLTLDKAAVGGGSKDNLTAYFNKLNGLNMQWQIENAASFADWGYDSDNGFVVDNIKIERVFTGLTLTAAQDGTDIVLNWPLATDGTTKLQAASTVDGTYSDVVTDGSTTYRETMSGNRFFRLAWTAPVTP